MANFRKKPVDVEAIAVSEIIALATTNWDGLPQWVQDQYNSGNVIFGNAYLIINGGIVANSGGYLVFENNALCFCDALEFGNLYEPVVTSV